MRSWNMLIRQSVLDSGSTLKIKIPTYIYRHSAEIFKASYDTVHSTTGMAPSPVTDADVLAICRRVQAKKQSFRITTAKLRVGQHVRVNKE